MEPPQNLAVDEIDLSDDKFWALPIDQRDQYREGKQHKQHRQQMAGG